MAIIPLTGATNLPSVGTITTPLPNAPEANASSSVSDKALTSPFNGLHTILLSTLYLNLQYL